MGHPDIRYIIGRLVGFGNLDLPLGVGIMFATSLFRIFEPPAVTGIYAGAETALRFGSVAEELHALRHGCGIFDLGWRGKLVVSGEDRVRWLNGMVTNNTRDLPQDFGNYSFVLDAKGHIPGDLMAFQRGDFYLVEAEAGQLPTLREFFDRYIIMDDVEIEDISAKLASLGVGGPHALRLLREAGLVTEGAAAKLKPGQILDAVWQGRGFSIVRDPVAVRDWYELWLAPENVKLFWSHLLSAGAAPAGAEALEQQRILLGLAEPVHLVHEQYGVAAALLQRQLVGWVEVVAVLDLHLVEAEQVAVRFLVVGDLAGTPGDRLVHGDLAGRQVVVKEEQEVTVLVRRRRGDHPVDVVIVGAARGYRAGRDGVRVAAVADHQLDGDTGEWLPRREVLGRAEVRRPALLLVLLLLLPDGVAV